MIDTQCNVTTICTLDEGIYLFPTLSSFKLNKKQDSNLFGIALDEKNGFIYVTDERLQVNWRMSLNGKDPIVFSGTKGKICRSITTSNLTSIEKENVDSMMAQHLKQNSITHLISA